MAGGMALFAATDAIAKLLTETLPAIQIVWSRQCGLLVGILIVIAIHGFKVLKSTQPILQISRGVLAAISATLFIVAVGYVPLVDAVALTFVAPFMVTILGAIILKETVGVRRWIAVTIGFIGTLIVIRPGMGIVHPASFLLIIAAAAFAARQILSRTLAGGDKTSTTVAYTAIVSWTLLSIPLAFVWQTPSTMQEIILLVTIAFLAAIAETLVIMALSTAQAVVVAPVQYTLLLWGTMYGFLIFGHLPDFWTLVGAVVIVATGLYTLNRERLAINKEAQNS
jgi:S-adenosylmethionine uptake transporter